MKGKKPESSIQGLHEIKTKNEKTWHRFALLSLVSLARQIRYEQSGESSLGKHARYDTGTGTHVLSLALALALALALVATQGLVALMPSTMHAMSLLNWC